MSAYHFDPTASVIKPNRGNITETLKTRFSLDIGSSEYGVALFTSRVHMKTADNLHDYKDADSADTTHAILSWPK